jgi:hypothetical protein
MDIGEAQHERFSLLAALGFQLRQPMPLDGSHSRRRFYPGSISRIAGVNLSEHRECSLEAVFPAVCIGLSID